MQRKEFILKILEIIGYQDDKEAFVEDFFTTIKQRTATKMLQEIPQEKLQVFEESATTDTNPSIDQVASAEQLEQAFQNEYDALLSEWFDDIKTSLSSDQIKNLSDLFGQFSSNKPQASQPTP
ncbi:hypothetical protein HYU92_02630 [Candidatus Curtissbacteria bacterium]|nr:hypothetical protein [Candidatus Curtissbacteria bacterium]